MTRLAIAVFVLGLALGAAPPSGAQARCETCRLEVVQHDDDDHVYFEIRGSGFAADRPLRVEVLSRRDLTGMIFHVTPTEAGFAGLFVGKDGDGEYVRVAPGLYSVRVFASQGYRLARTSFTVAKPLPKGSWGNDSAGLRVTGSGATLDLNCAGGSVDRPILLDKASSFDVEGIYISGRAGPSAGERHPARFSGTVRGNTLALTVTRTDTGEVVGNWELTFGVEFSDPCV